MMEMFAWLAAAAGLGVALVKRRKAFFQFVKKYAVVCAVLVAFLLWVALSLLASDMAKPFLHQWGFMRWTLLLFGLTQALIVFWSPAVERRWVWIWGVCLLVTGAYATLQFFTGMDFIRPDRHVVNPQGGGVFKAVGFFSMSLTFAYVFGQSALAVIRRGSAVWGLKVAWVVGAVATMGILASMSRGAWIAAVVACAFYLAVEKRKWFLPFSAVIVAAVIGAAMLNDGVGEKIRQMTSFRMDHSSSVRVSLWRGHWEMFKDNPLFGVGIFESDKYLPGYYSKLGIEETFVSHAHNNFLQWLTGTGILGLLFYLYLSWFFAKGAWDMRRRDGWGWGLLLAQLFFHLGGLTEANFFDGEVNHFVVFVWALTWSRMDHFTVISPARGRVK
jgi:O-antigen ligase